MSSAPTDQADWLKSQVPVGNPDWKRGGPSPNPAGRPKGSSPQQKLMMRMLEYAGEVLDAVLTKAKDGDPGAAGLVPSRILPVLRSQSEKVLFEFDASLPIARQVEQVLAAIAAGQLAPDIGHSIIASIVTLSQVRATEELAARLAILEAKAVN